MTVVPVSGREKTWAALSRLRTRSHP